MAKLLRARRPAHLAMATGICLATFVPADEWTAKGRSDRFWLDLFSNPKREISKTLVRDFINQYTLHRQGRWDYKKVIKQLTKFGRGNVGVSQDVEKFAESLAYCVPARTRKGTQREEMKRQAAAEQHSAASKFAFFSQPAAQHHILDSFVCSALSARQEATVPVRYARFFSIASEEYQKEGEEFDKVFAGYLPQQAGTLANIPRDFQRRYSFDKFLLVQGAFVKAELDRLKAGPDPNSAPRRRHRR